MTDLVIDSFAGGGGASLGIAWALGRGVDIAINHDAEALAMHIANHPEATHYCTNIWQIDPADALADAVHGNACALAWFSPDCKHFSKAKGGRPVKRHIRDLAWIVVLWAKRARPRVIMLENVEEFRDWGPVNADGFPCRERRGETFRRWLAELRRLGYKVEHRELRACDYGAPTIRKRLFLIARRDGEPIVWPEPTHGPGKLPWRTAADIIDWSLPCHSIFLSKEEGKAVGVKRPLVENTMRRIARGVQRYVIDHADPFIVPVTTAPRGEHALVTPYFVQRYGEREGQEPRTRPVTEPLQTIVPTANGATLVAPVVVKQNHGDKPYHDVAEPLHTVTTQGNKHTLVAAFLAQHNTGMTGHDSREPVSTIVQKGCTQAVVASHLINLKGTDRAARAIDAPAPTLTAQGTHLGEVRAFLMKYYGEGGQWQDCREPLHTAVTKARMGLVTVSGNDYQIVDIGMRMLTPRELFRAQGFADDYVIDPIYQGRPLTKTAQIRMCGNSVSPQIAEALVRANLGEAARVSAAA